MSHLFFSPLSDYFLIFVFVFCSDRQERERDSIKKFENYNPVVNIQYTDKFGRTLDPKEAFTLLSHEFHGKGPGKKNMEKHLRKIEAEMKQKKGDSASFLNSVAALEQRQKSLGQAGIVIQMGNKQVLPPSVSISDTTKKGEQKKRKPEPGEGGESKKSKN